MVSIVFFSLMPNLEVASQCCASSSKVLLSGPAMRLRGGVVWWSGEVEGDGVGRSEGGDMGGEKLPGGGGLFLVVTRMC